ncbi:cysteine desulfurase family protein [Maritimibacter sp. DP1N21-5]|uniref:cysteine desulfurase family protein n=1 Tax=Maritimibacter sp. DP1N21-5 TaxID=2836867 RepID=UPI001C48F8E5|nr:aminotransferase class V-fold PLP-dependent enzyme [Maritimibacter sp. DP1N21-5]MBV7409810.1 aminotransferase class V-fold PLP-dependent enzyme [Maritimibacter sp. DP1N21-5]
MARTYLDFNATMPLRPEARDAMVAAMDQFGNPSSVHAEGRAAKGIIETARRQVAALVGCQPREVVFTSGATEGASVLAHLRPAMDVRVDATAHDALWAHATSDASPQPSGDRPQAFALGLGNSETGVLAGMPDKVDGTWRIEGGEADLLLLDVTQAVGRVPFAFSWSGADLAVLSAHKIGGPKGVGALIVRQGLDIEALAVGGGQEMGRRSGTENVMGIAGFGAAAEAAMRDLDVGLWDKIREFRTFLEKALSESAKETIFVGKDANRLPNTSCFITPGWKGETQVMVMDLAGFAVSAGSACSSGKVRASRVLQAMGYDEGLAANALRVSLGPTTTKDEVERFCEAWLREHEKFRARSM